MTQLDIATLTLVCEGKLHPTAVAYHGMRMHDLKVRAVIFV